MSSSPRHPIPSSSTTNDIESRFPPPQSPGRDSCSCCAEDDGKKPRSLPVSQINWDAYFKSGNRASFLWLFILFSVLGIFVQQSAGNAASTIPSTLDDAKSFSPPVLAGRGGTTRNMMEVASNPVPSVSDPSTRSTATNDERVEEAKSVGSETPPQTTKGDVDASSGSGSSSTESEDLQKTIAKTA